MHELAPIGSLRHRVRLAHTVISPVGPLSRLIPPEKEKRENAKQSHQIPPLKIPPRTKYTVGRLHTTHSVRAPPCSPPVPFPSTPPTNTPHFKARRKGNFTNRLTKSLRAQKVPTGWPLAFFFLASAPLPITVVVILLGSSNGLPPWRARYPITFPPPVQPTKLFACGCPGWPLVRIERMSLQLAV